MDENPGTWWSNMSRNDSQNPIVSIATHMELAKVNIKPIAPPNSGPMDKLKQYCNKFLVLSQKFLE